MKVNLSSLNIKKAEWVEIAIPGDLTIIVYGDGHVTIETDFFPKRPYGDVTVNLKKRLKKKLTVEATA